MYGNYDPGAPGVVGPAGVGGIYKIDGATGQISIFMNTGFNGITEMPNLGPGLGNIHIQDNGANQTDQLYATNLDDGKIYLIDASGMIVQAYDPFSANQSADGTFATLGERPFAVAVNPQGTRLLFSVWLRDSARHTTPWPASAGPAPANPNNSIWSVQINTNGLMVGLPQLEIVLPYLSGTYSNPVTDISFTASGALLVAERVFNGDYGMFDMGHTARILEYENNLPSSRHWNLGSSLSGGIAANAVGGVSSDDDSHTWASCDQIVGGGTYGITRLPYPGNTIATRITSSIPIDIPGPLKNGMGEIDCMICNTPEPVGACCVTDTNGTDYCVEVTSDECMYTYAGTYYGVGSNCTDATTCPTVTGEGACCYEDPDLGWTCVWTDEGECDNYFFGTWYSNTPCSQIDCESTDPEGACCYEDVNGGWSCVWTDQDQCENVYFGTWYDGIPCIDIECPPLNLGACCYTIDCEWFCDMLTFDACEALLGIFYSQSTCDDGFECNQEDYGACCYENAAGIMTCVWTHIEKCDFYYFGIWHPGESCECIPCDQPPPTGACCYMNASGDMLCATMEIGPCLALPNSTFYGVGSLCDDVVCCDPVGSCCILGNCLLASADQCELAQGTFAGIGTQCVNMNCENCIGDINHDGQVNVADLLIMIAAFGVCP